MKALLINQQRNYFRKVQERAYEIPIVQYALEDDSELSIGSSRSWIYAESDISSGEDFVRKNIQNATQRPRSASTRAELSTAPIISVSKVSRDSFLPHHFKCVLHLGIIELLVTICVGLRGYCCCHCRAAAIQMLSESAAVTFYRILD